MIIPFNSSLFVTGTTWLSTIGVALWPIFDAMELGMLSLHKCDLTTVWSRPYWTLVTLIFGTFALAFLGAWLVVKCARSRCFRKSKVAESLRPSKSDAMAILPQPKAHQRTMVIRTIAPTAMDLSAGKANRYATLKPYHQKVLELNPLPCPSPWVLNE